MNSRIVNPILWESILQCPVGASFDLREETLKDVVHLILQNPPNCNTLLNIDMWQTWILQMIQDCTILESGVNSKPKDVKGRQCFMYAMNIMVCYYTIFLFSLVGGLFVFIASIFTFNFF